MKCGKKLSHYYHPNLDIGAGHPVLIVKLLKAFCGYLEPEPRGEICPRTMDLGVRVSTGKCSKTMWTMKITP
jgi:hypothetical protein